MRSRLAELAARQGGAFTAAQALRAGYSRDAIRHAVETGRWLRPVRGILTTPEVAPVGTPERLLREAWIALLTHPGAVIGFAVAAELHGLATYRPGRGLELIRGAAPGRTPGRTPGRDGSTLQVAALPAGHVAAPRGVPATSLARTAADLARRGSLRDGVVVLDSALQLGCSRSDVDEVVHRCAGWPGIRELRAAWSVADEGSESPLESLAHVLQHEQRIPRPRTQVAIFDERGFVGRVDDYWPQFATVGESDGLAKYDEPGALRREKLRQERLEQAGLQIVRVTYADVTKAPASTARRYREAFARGQQRLSWRPIAARIRTSPVEWGLEVG